MVKFVENELLAIKDVAVGTPATRKCVQRITQ